MKAFNRLIMGLLAIAVVILVAYVLIEEADDGPLENAAEEIENAVDDVQDGIEQN